MPLKILLWNYRQRWWLELLRKSLTRVCRCTAYFFHGNHVFTNCPFWGWRVRLGRCCVQLHHGTVSGMLSLLLLVTTRLRRKHTVPLYNSTKHRPTLKHNDKISNSWFANHVTWRPLSSRPWGTLFTPQNFTEPLYPISPGYYSRPKRN